MKTNNSLASIFLLILLFLFGCDTPLGVERFSLLRVKNISSSGIAFYVGYVYPDTSIYFTYESTRTCPANTQVPYQIEKTWEAVYNELPADTLSIYIFSSDTLLKYDWALVQNEYMILKRYDLSYQDLIDKNYIINYP